LLELQDTKTEQRPEDGGGRSAPLAQRCVGQCQLYECYVVSGADCTPVSMPVVVILTHFCGGQTRDLSCPRPVDRPLQNCGGPQMVVVMLHVQLSGSAVDFLLSVAEDYVLQKHQHPPTGPDAVTTKSLK